MWWATTGFISIICPPHPHRLTTCSGRVGVVVRVASAAQGVATERSAVSRLLLQRHLLIPRKGTALAALKANAHRALASVASDALNKQARLATQKELIALQHVLSSDADARGDLDITTVRGHGCRHSDSLSECASSYINSLGFENPE